MEELTPGHMERGGTAHSTFHKHSEGSTNWMQVWKAGIQKLGANY